MGQRWNACRHSGPEDFVSIVGRSSSETQLETLGNKLLFAANDGTHGTEIWKSDGTANGTVLVRDIISGSGSSQPKYLTSIGTKILFEATDATGAELWATDGTSSGTVQVKDIYPGTSSSDPSGFTNVNGTLFFAAFDGGGAHGEELWSSDGTPANTHLVRDIASGPRSSQPENLTNTGERLIFNANDGSKNQIWVSDGTTSGTIPLFYFPGAARIFGDRLLVTFGHQILFINDDGSHGDELWIGAEPNAPPTGRDQAISMREHTSRTLSIADFGFSDSGNTIPDSLAAVLLDSLPTIGVLKDGGSTVTVGMTIPAADIVAGQLVYTAPATAGDQTSLSFQVRDAGGTASGGSDFDATPKTLTLNIIGANDPPVGSNGSLTAFDHATYSFSFAEFGFSDPLDAPPNHLFGVKIDSVPAAGTLMLNGQTVKAGQVVPVTGSSLVFTPAVTSFSSQLGYAAFTFQEQDDGGTANGGSDLDPTARTLTINLQAIHNAPAGAAKVVTVLEDQAYVFSSADFGFSDSGDNPPDLLIAVKVASLPASGSLLLGGSPVAAGDSIASGALPTLIFQPAPNANGNPYASFTFQVQDGGGTASGSSDLDPAAKTLSIVVTPVNDPPLGASKNITTTEDTDYTFSLADFGFSDANDLSPPSSTPANQLLNVIVVSLPVQGELRQAGQALTPDQLPLAVPTATIAGGGLSFHPAADANGDPYATFGFQLHDDGGIANGGADLSSPPTTVTLAVLSANDPPVSQVKTVTTLEDAAYTLKADDFAFSDTHDNPPNEFIAVQLAQSPMTGTLLDGAKTLAAGDFIPLADIAANQVKFIPAADANSDAGGTFGFLFRVQDDGGTANGGVDLDGVARSFSIVVTEVNDPPHFAAGAAVTTTDENGAVTLAGWASISAGAANEAAQKLTIQIDVTNQGLFAALPSLDASGKLAFTPRPNVSGESTVTITVTDDGGTANGGSDSIAPQTFTITINKPHAWHNSAAPCDVDQDLHIAPGDALAVINYINSVGSGPIAKDATLSGYYYDVNGDQFVAPNDALMVINYINAHPSQSGSPAGEGEAVVMRS